MKSRLFPCFLYLLPVLFFMSCGDLKEPDFKSIENVRVSKLGLTESTLSLHLNYFNPNKFRIKLEESGRGSLDRNNYLGHFTIDTMIDIPANGAFRLPVKLQVDMARIFKNSFLSFLAREVTIKVEGRGPGWAKVLFISITDLVRGEAEFAGINEIGAKGTRYKAQGTRDKAQGTRYKGQGTRI